VTRLGSTQIAAFICSALLYWASYLALLGCGVLAGQNLPPSNFSPSSLSPSSRSLLSPDQLDTLVAPVALYPDPLLAQVLAASTYPLELVEAQQWISQQQGLQGRQLVEAAKQQNWDPSVQAMAAFPDVLSMLTRDVRWTTDLGNAFLGQQGEVMAAVQRLRARAQSSGTLRSTPQQVVTTEGDYGQSPIAIQPADPQVIYVPTYNPAYVWGPPAWGAYPPLYYPSYGPSYGYGFGAATFLGALFSGLVSFGGWGWGLSWLTHGLFINSLFFSHFGFGGGYGSGYGGSTIWAHNPAHRLGVAYPSHVAAHFASASTGNWRTFNNRGTYSGSPRGFAANPSQGWRSFGGNRSGGGDRGSTPVAKGGSFERPLSQSYRSNAGGLARAFAGPTSQNSAREFSGSGSNGLARAPSQTHFSAPRAPSQHFSAPRSSGQHFSAPHSSGPKPGRPASGHGGSHSGGGHSGRSKHR
jgi:hypothetical protein